MSATHNPGGRSKRTVDPSMISTATFTECGRYRQTLIRCWDTLLPTIVFVGMNPSVADTTVDDPTCAKERRWAQLWGYGTYVKLNVMDYRATNPKHLLQPELVVQTPSNLACMAEHISQAALVIAAWGCIHPKLRCHQHNVEQLLIQSGATVQCMGINLDGSPRHPLYLKSNTTPMEFNLNYGIPHES